MWIVQNEKEITALEERRALVGVFLDRRYSHERVDWLLRAKGGFDEHARDAWHLLIPVTHGYGVDTYVDAQQYNVKLAAAFIDRLEVGYPDLPCIAFRARGEEYYFLKLGRLTQEAFHEEVGRIADLARECQRESTAQGPAYRDYVNMQIANHLRRRKMLSATQRALPVLSALLGVAVDIKELV